MDTEFVKLCDEFDNKVNFQCKKTSSKYFLIFENFYQNPVDLVKKLPSSSIISSMEALGDDGGVSSLAIFFARALSSVILNLREFQKYFHEFFLQFLHHVLTFVFVGTVLQDYYD